jgi:transcriptional regulator with XRE-family HTH domain
MNEMIPRVKALVKPELLVWAREDAGYSLDEAAKKIQVSPERLASWEQGGAHPSVVQLRKLARVYKRPIAVFYLPKPPKKFQAMQDFRRLSGEVAGHESPELRFAIKRAHFQRQVALDLCELLGIEPAFFSGKALLSEDSEDVAARTRSELGLRLEEQHKWKSEYEAVNGWRSSLEGLGVLVFQVQDVEVLWPEGV